MSHPVLWTQGTVFLPLNSTPAVDILQDLPPEEDAHVLLLGCGDPRSILFTLYNRTRTSKKQQPMFDVTCCDIEPAILARNVLLLTLIVDDCPADHIWNIFFHFRIDTKSIPPLRSQCEKLIACSATLEQWQKSEYSSFITFCTRRTLSQLHDQWKRYADPENYSENGIKELNNRVATVRAPMKCEDDILPTLVSRSAGPFYEHAGRALSYNCGCYWDIGNVDIDTKRGTISVTKDPPNPLFFFALNGQGRNFHYSTYPLSGFLLAEAFAATGPGVKSPEQLVACAKNQFRQWCGAFREAVLSQTGNQTRWMKIRLFAGDALAFCRALHSSRETHVRSPFYTSPWTHTPLVLDGGDYGPNATSSAPTSFNVIDTSDLMDSLGLLNVITVTVPLLADSPVSTLYTEATLIFGDNALTSFKEQLCTDIVEFAILFGIAPVSYISQYMTSSNVYEILGARLRKGETFYERIPWKITSTIWDSVTKDLSHVFPSSVPHFEYEPLADLVFKIYHKMFLSEHEAMIRKATLIPIHYNRASLALILHFLKGRIRTNWSLFVAKLQHLILQDGQNTLIWAPVYLLEMFGLFAIQNVTPRPSFSLGESVSQAPDLFDGWKKVPDLICMVVVITRAKLKPLESNFFFQAFPPILTLGLKTPRSQLYHLLSYAQFTFGSYSTQGTGEETTFTIVEDSEGFRGTSDLIASVWIDSKNLVKMSSSTEVHLELQGVGSLVLQYKKALEPNPVIFSAKLTNRSAVYFMKERPGNPGELAMLKKLSPSPPPEPSPLQTFLDLDDTSAISWIRTRITPTIESEKRAVASGAKFETESVCMSLVILKAPRTSFNKEVVFPVPVNHNKIEVNVDQKAGYIEVIAPPTRPFNSLNFSMTDLAPFQFNTRPSGSLNPWSFHRVCTAKSPAIARLQTSRNFWSSNFTLSLSDRERVLRETGIDRGRIGAKEQHLLVHLKETILILLQQSFQYPNHYVFDLQDPDRGGAHCIIFMNELRLDLPNRMLFADCFLMPLTSDIIRPVDPARNLTKFGEIVTVKTRGSETLAWYWLQPTLVERCRTWPHKPSCEYKTQKHSPSLRESPLCKCGRGIGADSKVVNGLFSTPLGKIFQPYVTRAAISQPLPVSYLESVMSPRYIVPKSAEMTEAMNLSMNHTLKGSLTECAKCGVKGATTRTGVSKLMWCAQCRAVKYCGVECQRSHWKEHKDVCKKLKLVTSLTRSTE